MKDTKLLTYYSLLVAYLIVAFFLETNLRIIINVLFCLISALFYYLYQKPYLTTQNIYYIFGLCLGAIGCYICKWRFLQIGQTLELITSIFMLLCFLLSIKNKNQYLFLGTKWVLLLGIILTLLSILYFTNHFLPHISDFNVPLAIIIVFILGFLFIITLIRTVNHVSSFQLFLGVCLIIGSYVVAAFSTYHKVINMNNFWEDILSIVGVFFLTLGMIKNSLFSKKTGLSSESPAQLSLSHFLKKIFY